MNVRKECGNKFPLALAFVMLPCSRHVVVHGRGVCFLSEERRHVVCPHVAMCQTELSPHGVRIFLCRHLDCVI